VGDLLAFKVLNVAFHDPHDISGHSPSNGACEHVVEDTYERGFPAAYHRDTAWSYPPFEESYGSYDFKKQNMVDRGAGLPDAQRYCLYSAGPNYPGCFHWPTERWFALQLGIQVGLYGGPHPGNVFDMWMYDKPTDTNWNHLIHSEGHDVGPAIDAGRGDHWTGGLNGIYLHMYESQSKPAVDTHGKYGQLMVGRTMFPIPQVI